MIRAVVGEDTRGSDVLGKNIHPSWNWGDVCIHPSQSAVES
jgi:hypothetical protein